MHTLREVVDFTGVAGTAGRSEGNPRPVGLHSSGDLVAAVVPADQRSSLRGLCAALPTLPPIALDARVTGHGDVVGPSRPFIEVDVPAGAVVETVVNFFSGGVSREPSRSEGVRFLDGFRIDGTLFSSAVFDEPGLYEGVVTRVGVTSSGVTRLERRVSFQVRAVPVPTPPTPPSPPQPPRPPVGPTCEVELVGRSGGTSDVRVFGGGFPAGDGLTVLEDGGFGATTVADGLGSYSVVIGVLTSTPPFQHRFQTVSQSTGATSKEAGFTV